MLFFIVSSTSWSLHTFLHYIHSKKRNTSLHKRENFNVNVDPLLGQGWAKRPTSPRVDGQVWLNTNRSTRREWTPPIQNLIVFLFTFTYSTPFWGNDWHSPATVLDGEPGCPDSLRCPTSVQDPRSTGSSPENETSVETENENKIMGDAWGCGRDTRLHVRGRVSE